MFRVTVVLQESLRRKGDKLFFLEDDSDAV